MAKERGHALAQLNIALMNAPLDAPEMADFVANLDRINALAEAAPGFIWRLQSEGGDATAFRPFGDEVLVNLSKWRDVDALRAYVYDTAHAEIMRRRREWFERMKKAHMVLWWVPSDHRPDLAEAAERLDALRRDGPTPKAFTFRDVFAPPS
ncbi:MAG: DUF3291 domain-containing protein [Myxococcota bacterium]